MTEETENSTPGAHVIELESRLREGAKPRLTVAREPVCLAHHFELDRETRLVTCTKCKQTFDGFEALLYLAEHWGDFHGNRSAIKKELAALSERRSALEEEVSRLKSSVNRKLRRIAECSPHATKALELALRIYRKPAHTGSGDRMALLTLLRQVEDEAKIVPVPRPSMEPT